ncbi:MULTISPECIES: hypothetical protein [unclassified Mesorhizobium]|uniref:hypothetical protein n=1 Tax=unclassified Mesorhizobium TaxID=325217 RepID=UPI000FC9EA78|nr:MULTISPECIES: hypothetical protein [unclassified Mesorhizobium]RUU30756.1 hypothetical protein EOC94_07125 [Mesorhizobium sp. M6A.T.Ce.TU.016.01.1.1]RWN36478.1 MAG: hypothetical protein EOR95_10240 [Mesorhizobium sp.]RWN67676.1 MAG: hypothetical protein EOR99_10425 [Mesorhizobium sp.]RWP01507.1 MAG: hypothetical protein EOQ98_07455 [Mesorhizobium sp.]RWQ88669.1 MAG: hypothetical protein EOS85_02980 [Mesorhizobium sp.]
MKKLDQIVNFFFSGASILEASYNPVERSLSKNELLTRVIIQAQKINENNGLTNGRRTERAPCFR